MAQGDVFGASGQSAPDTVSISSGGSNRSLANLSSNNAAGDAISNLANVGANLFSAYLQKSTRSTIAKGVTGIKEGLFKAQTKNMGKTQRMLVKQGLLQEGRDKGWSEEILAEISKQTPLSDDLEMDGKGRLVWKSEKTFADATETPATGHAKRAEQVGVSIGKAVAFSPELDTLVTSTNKLMTPQQKQDFAPLVPAISLQLNRIQNDFENANLEVLHSSTRSVAEQKVGISKTMGELTASMDQAFDLLSSPAAISVHADEKSGVPNNFLPMAAASLAQTFKRSMTSDISSNLNLDLAVFSKYLDGKVEEVTKRAKVMVSGNDLNTKMEQLGTMKKVSEMKLAFKSSEIKNSFSPAKLELILNGPYFNSVATLVASMPGTAASKTATSEALMREFISPVIDSNNEVLINAKSAADFHTVTRALTSNRGLFHIMGKNQSLVYKTALKHLSSLPALTARDKVELQNAENALDEHIKKSAGFVDQAKADLEAVRGAQ
jgi:hypothetical protein